MSRPSRTRSTVAGLAVAVGLLFVTASCTDRSDRSVTRRPTATSSATARPRADAPPGGPDPGKVAFAVAVPSTAVVGSSATAVFRTRPGTSCRIALRYPDGSQDVLAPSTADATGTVSWTWTTRHSTGKTMSGAVSCSGGERGAAVISVA